MEVYVLDSLLRREVVVDKFVSLIWTERWREIGDFELSVLSTPGNRGIFLPGKKLSLNESYRMMEVETVEDATDTDGKKTLKVKGRSSEKVLEDRTAMDPTNFTIGNNQWKLTGTPKAIAQKLYDDICVTGKLSTSDIIPLQGSGTIFPTDTIPPLATSMDWYVEPQTLLQAITDLCDIYEMGFRLVRNPTTNLLRFDIYTGSNRTPAQTALPAVIFSPELENLQSTTEVTTSVGVKNCAYVITEYGGSYYQRLVYDVGIDPLVTGFERKVLTLTVTLAEDQISTIPASINAALDKAGKDELAKYRPLYAFDGEVSQRSQYKYGVDYHLGDLVGMQNADGNVSYMRVTEQIFASDDQGDRSYPTLTVNLTIEPGTWESWGYQAWGDLDLNTTAWADQP